MYVIFCIKIMNTESDGNNFVNTMGLLSIFLSHLYIFGYFGVFVWMIFSSSDLLEAMFGAYGTIGRILYSLLFAGLGMLTGIVMGKKYDKKLLGMEIGLICSLVIATLYVLSAMGDPSFQLFAFILIANGMTIACSLVIRKIVRIASAWIYRKIYK